MYCIRVNGNITDFLYPQRGICQGNPLSPYIFLICTEWLSHTFYALHTTKSLKGLRICRQAPRLTHLLFADDSLVFFEVVPNTTSLIKKALADYEALSGQQAADLHNVGGVSSRQWIFLEQAAVMTMSALLSGNILRMVVTTFVVATIWLLLFGR
ncbi:hypothetical protein QQ045_010080 [Rhodiola kirilowii]